MFAVTLGKIDGIRKAAHPRQNGTEIENEQQHEENEHTKKIRSFHLHSAVIDVVVLQYYILRDFFFCYSLGATIISAFITHNVDILFGWLVGMAVATAIAYRLMLLPLSQTSKFHYGRVIRLMDSKSVRKFQ